MEKIKDDLKNKIVVRGIKAIPNFVWAFCASYALIMMTNLFFIKFANISMDQHINRYFEIKLNEIESKNCGIAEFDSGFIEDIKHNKLLIDSNIESIQHLTKNSHKPRGK
jgi:hypothetical protein